MRKEACFEDSGVLVTVVMCRQLHCVAVPTAVAPLINWRPFQARGSLTEWSVAQLSQMHKIWLLKRITPLHNIHKSLSRNQRARLESCHISKWTESGPLSHPGPYSVMESGPLQSEGYW